MTVNIKKLGFVAMIGMFLMCAHGVKAHEMMSMPKTTPAFEKIKQLVGTWTGTTEMGGKPTEYTVTYSLTAGGNAVIEREFAGSPKEMASVYYLEGNNVAVTHYCMLGNQPHMILKSVSRNTLNFEMQGTTGIISPKEDHMHSLSLTLVDSNHLTAKWTEYHNGVKHQEMTMELTRKS